MSCLVCLSVSGHYARKRARAICGVRSTPLWWRVQADEVDLLARLALARCCLRARMHARPTVANNHANGGQYRHWWMRVCVFRPVPFRHLQASVAFKL